MLCPHVVFVGECHDYCNCKKASTNNRTYAVRFPIETRLLNYVNIVIFGTQVRILIILPNEPFPQLVRKSRCNAI